jgi:hypothetical protein
MKRKCFLIIFISFLFTLDAQQRIYFYELEYADFSNKLYRTVGKTKLFNDELSGIETIDLDIIFQSSALAYAQSESKEPYDIYDHLIGFKDGWISTDDLIIDGSDTFPDSIIATKQNKNNTIWIPSWYNTIISNNKKLEDYSDWYRRYKNVEEIPIVNLHTIEIRNTCLTMFDTNRIICFSIKKIKKMVVFIKYFVK